MAKYVPDATTRRWVVIAPDRVKRIHDVPDTQSGSAPSGSTPSLDDQVQTRTVAYESSAPVSVTFHLPVQSGTDIASGTTHISCPFCPGHEVKTPPEVYRIGDGAENTPGWTVRVVPNKFPITDIHEVIIHSPDHDTPIEDMPPEAICDVLKAYRNRSRIYASTGTVMVFCNYGDAAGASKLHPHSQLVVIPSQISLDAVSREPVANTVEETSEFVSYCPDFSQWPLETWIAPTSSETSFIELHTDSLSSLATILGRTIRRIKAVVRSGDVPFDPQKGFSYNFYISQGKQWFIRIMPRLIHRAGFELGTGLSVNIIDPSDAAEMMKKQKTDDR